MNIRLPKPEEQFDKFTPLPNVFFEQLMKIMDPYSWMILTYMGRKLYGFHKDKDQISMAQIEQDLGMCHATVSDRVNKLLDAKIIKISEEAVRQAKQARYYSINHDKNINL